MLFCICLFLIIVGYIFINKREKNKSEQKNSAQCQKA